MEDEKLRDVELSKRCDSSVSNVDLKRIVPNFTTLMLRPLAKKYLELLNLNSNLKNLFSSEARKKT